MKANYGNNYSKLTRKEIAKNEEKLRDIVYAYFHKPEVFRRIVEGEEVEVDSSDYPELCSEGLEDKNK